MKKVTIAFLCLLKIAIATAQVNCPPPNIGFEDGTFNRWKVETGYIDGGGNLHFTVDAAIDGRQTLTSKTYTPSTDYYGGFPVLCPNGSGHSVILGNATREAETTPVLGGEAERISYTFTVPASASQYNLVVNYAVVSQDTHTRPENMRAAFRIRVFDVTDSIYIDCASSDIYYEPLLPQWKHKPFQDAYYTDWTANALNLNGYQGKKLRIEFITNHTYIASVRGLSDFTYAYIDINENCSSLISGNTYCSGQSSLTLSAPAGFGDYYWYNASDFTKRLSKEKTLTISPPPPDNTKYALVLHTQNGFVCADTLYTVVNKNDAGFTFKAIDTLYICPQTPVDLTLPAITTGSSSGLKYYYYNDFAGTLYTYNPQNITTPGVYYIKALSLQGCSNTLPVNILSIDSKLINVTDPARVTYPATVDLTGTFNHLTNFSYAYFSDSLARKQLPDPTHIKQYGQYYIKAINNNTGCFAIAPVTVTIDPPVKTKIIASNTFTPNSDGINDYFFIKIEGYATFGSLKIYSRNGQLVYEIKSADGTWDGTIAGDKAPPGTYYWVFEGVDEYYHSINRQSGSVTIVR